MNVHNAFILWKQKREETVKKMELFDSVGKAGMSQAFDKDAIIRSVVEEVLRTIGK